jgi:hypothetical protein
VEGEVDVTFTPDLPVDRLVFRLWPNTPRLQAGGSHLDIIATGTDRGGFARLPDPTTLELVLASPADAGTPVRATMSYRLVVVGAVRDRVARGPGWLRVGSFLPLLAWEPGRGWALEPPTSGFAEAATSPVADYELAISAPPGATVLAAGVPDGAGRWFATAVRDVALSVGSFRLAEATVGEPAPVRVIVGVEATMADDEAVYLDRVVAALADFAQRYGPYPWPTLTLALTPELTGGIEFPSHVMQGSGSLGRTTPHEVAHQWFYGLVGNDQGRDPVLDEGLATYAEAVHERTLDAFVAAAVPPGAAGLAGEPMTWWEDRFDQYYLGIYAQGAQAVAALGPVESVDCGLRRYVAANAHRLATQADLVAAMATVFPDARATLAAYGIG